MANYTFGIAIVRVENDLIEIFAGDHLDKISRIYFNEIESVEIRRAFKGYIISRIGYLRFVVPGKSFSPNCTNTELMSAVYPNVVPVIEDSYYQVAESCIAELKQKLPDLKVNYIAEK